MNGKGKSANAKISNSSFQYHNAKLGQLDLC